jgi:hypothetical protein
MENPTGLLPQNEYIHLINSNMLQGSSQGILTCGPARVRHLPARMNMMKLKKIK